MTALPRLPVTLYPSRWRHALLLVVSAGFVAMGVFLLGKGEDWVAWACIGFFGLGVLAFAANLLPGASSLRLDGDDFTIRSLFRERRIAWQDVTGFRPVRIGTNQFVGFDYLPGVSERLRLRRLNSGVAGIEDMLPDRYGMRGEALADLMNTVRDARR